MNAARVHTLDAGSSFWPRGWQRVSEVTLVEPAAVPLDGRILREVPAPRASFFASTRPAPPTEDGLEGIKDGVLSMPGASVLEEGTFTFLDGVRAPSVKVMLHVGEPPVPMVQLHVIRAEAQVCSHLILTVPAARQSEVSGDLGMLVASFVPPSAHLI